MRRRATGRALAITIALAVAGGACTAAVAARNGTVTVRVTARDFAFTMSKRTVPPRSTVRFVVRNAGAVPHDFVLGKTRTRVLGPGASQTIVARFTRTGRFAFLCSVPGHAKLGMKGSFAVGKPAAKPPPAPPPTVDPASTVTLTEIGRFDRPVFVTAPPGDPRRLYIVEQRGTVQTILDGAVQAQPFFDIRERVHVVTETGLLSLAFAPDYAASRRFYAFFNQRKGNGDIRIAEFRTAAGGATADMSTERVLLDIVKPWENHNGGMLQFGPDGMLYASVGDGDSGVYNAPGAFAQSRDELLGNILRVDATRGSPYAVPTDNPFVREPGVRPEIWLYGLRNPWRFWIDHPTGVMLIGDVGLGMAEEIDLVPAGAKGLNFGWPCFEGEAAFDAKATCESPVAPLVPLPHADNSCSVIGGVVVRDARLPALAGRYLYGDFCTGRVTAIVVAGGRVTDSDDLGVTVPQLSSFGVDGAGRVYVTSLAGGVLRLDPKGA